MSSSSGTPKYLASRISRNQNRIVIASVTNAGIQENLSRGAINMRGKPTSCQMTEGITETNNHKILCLHRAEIQNEMDTNKIETVTSMLKSLAISVSTV